MRRKNSLIPEKYMLLNWGGVYMLLEYNNNIHIRFILIYPFKTISRHPRVALPCAFATYLVN